MHKTGDGSGIAQLRIDRSRGRDQFVDHHDVKYGGQLPIWVLTDVLDFAHMQTPRCKSVVVATRGRSSCLGGGPIFIPPRVPGMIANTCPDPTFIQSPAFGALLALLGTLITLGGTLLVANRTRGQQRKESLREALQAVLRQRHSLADNQERLYRPAFERLQARSITVDEFYEARDPYYDQCKELQLATATVRLFTKDADTGSARDQVDAICRDRLGDPITYGGREDGGTDQRTELKNATASAFDALQSAAQRILAA